MEQERGLVPQKQTHEQSELQKRSPEQLHAANWVEVSDGLMQARIHQLQELNAPQAQSPDFMGAHKAFIEFAREKLEDQDPNFVSLFSDLEIKALSQGPMHNVHYDLAHVKQLDFFASMVDEAQRRHDDQTDAYDPFEHRLDYRS